MRARKNGKEANGHVPTEITDPTDIKIIGVYLVQPLGHPSLDEILEVCRNKIKCEIDADDFDVGRIGDFGRDMTVGLFSILSCSHLCLLAGLTISLRSKQRPATL